MTALQNLLPELAEQVQALVDLISTEPGVRKIILFGSSATGQRTKDSDIDLLILVENSSYNTVQLSRSIRLRSYDFISFPLDLLVETEPDFADRMRLPTLERKIAREGKVLYAA